MKWAGVLASGIALASPLAPLCAQRVVERYEPAAGVVRIGPGPTELVSRTERGFTLLLPEAEVRAVVLFLDARRFDTDGFRAVPQGFDHTALTAGVGVLHLTTGNPLDFLFAERDVERVGRRVEAILAAEGLERTPLYLAGLSLGGTRALRLAIHLLRHPDEFSIQPRAVAVVDAPLDMVRFWHAEQDAIAANFHQAAAGEGRWVSYMLETELGGPPEERYDAYVQYSPYVHGAPLGGNARHLTRLPVRAYHEPDIDWWIANRRKSYYGMNSIDLAALVNRLQLMGNDAAELVTTHNTRDGFSAGSSPHTWSIVDEAALIRWFLAQ